MIHLWMCQQCVCWLYIPYLSLLFADVLKPFVSMYITFCVYYGSFATMLSKYDVCGVLLSRLQDIKNFCLPPIKLLIDKTSNIYIT
jgi:hypothetical protein